MYICIVYAGKNKEDFKLKDLANQFAKGFSENNHNVDVINMYTDDKKLTIYDYIVVVSTAISTWGGSTPNIIKPYLQRSGMVSGKRCAAFIHKGGIRSQKTLLSLMKAMENEGMYLKYSDIIKKPSSASFIAKRLNVERNY